MKVVTQNAINAFYSKGELCSGNTTVSFNNGISRMFLFGNNIATMNHDDNTLTIYNHGYKTVTTKDRLNALDGVSIKQIKGFWYLNGEFWDGTTIAINIKDK